MSNEDSLNSTHAAPLVAIVGWLVPGMGYWLLGQRAKALTVGITIILLFVMGILFAGVRVVDVPGYDEAGQKIYVELRRETGHRIVEFRTTQPTSDNSTWAFFAHPLAEVGNKPWFVGQILAGPISIVAAVASNHYGNIARTTARIAEIGTLYTAVAGLLNLLVIIDSTYRAGNIKGEEE